MKRETVALLERLDHADIPPDAHVRALRPAAQQVVSIARALSHDARLLIMDEPSAILDDEEVETLFGVVRRLTDEGVGVIYISHRLDEIPRIGDRVTVLSDGRTVATGLPADTPRRRAGRAHGRPQGRAALPRPRRAATGDVVLEVRGVSRRPDGQGDAASRSAPARCSASAAWSAPGAPSCCGWSTASTSPTPARSRGRQAGCPPASPPRRSPPGSGSRPRTASRRACCSTGA